MCIRDSGSIAISDEINGENHPFVEHFKFVKQFEDDSTVARQTIPAPAQLYAELFREKNGENTTKYLSLIHICITMERRFFGRLEIQKDRCSSLS